MSNENPIELAAEATGQACLYAVQALRQSTALIELLIAKNVLTKEEVDEQMRSTEHLTNSLTETAQRASQIFHRLKPPD
jgi:hypothetical protein